MRWLLSMLFAATLGAQDFDTPLGLARLTHPPIDTNSALIVVDTNWLAFGTNLSGVTNDLTVWLTNAGTATLTGTASTASPFSVVATASYSVATNTATNVVVRYTRSGEQTDTNELALSGVGGTNFNVHLSGRSTNAPGGGPPGFFAYATNATTSASSISLTLDAGSTTLRTVVAGLSWYSASDTTVSAITFGGDAMTLVALTNRAYDTHGWSGLWIKTNAASGAQTLSITLSGSTTELSLIGCAITNGSYYGVGIVTNVVDAPGITNVIPSASTDIVIDFVGCPSGAGDTYTPAGQTTWTNAASGSDNMGNISSVRTASGASTECRWTGSASFRNFNAVGIAIKGP